MRLRNFYKDKSGIIRRLENTKMNAFYNSRISALEFRYPPAEPFQVLQCAWDEGGNILIFAMEYLTHGGYYRESDRYQAISDAVDRIPTPLPGLPRDSANPTIAPSFLKWSKEEIMNTLHDLTGFSEESIEASLQARNIQLVG